MSHQDFNKAQDQPEKPKRPLYLTGTALALIAIGIWYLIALSVLALLPMFYHYVRSNPLVSTLIGIGMLVSLALVASGIGVIRGATWYRPLAILGVVFLFVKAAFPMLFTHGRPLPSNNGWVQIVFYLCISLLLFTRGASAFFRGARSKSFVR